MKNRVNNAKSIIIRWMIVLLLLLSIFVVLLMKARPIVISYAQSQAKSQMIYAFDEAVKTAMLSLDYAYNDLAVVTRKDDNMVSSIEIDYKRLNVLRSEISQKISEALNKRTDNILNIPIGTLLGNEYTTGYGPKIKFKMKFSQIPVLDFKSNFTSAGINSILHQIIIKADLTGSIIMLGADKSFSVSLTTIAAQTVISGAVPDSFTNVNETPDSNVADDIFNFSQ